ncbi:hypothetical protein FB45DRAFT_1098989 [Roridomyces roridus]|uniref:Mid2 domain-containing protein n=1 Tax=Roridomyces roridus TaxID=1738132 RepID=A0AAD7CG64_9AGAR|nr:hypothetical protein FB45DRAFT_1098989 [Roridomyces roridus]
MHPSCFYPLSIAFLLHIIIPLSFAQEVATPIVSAAPPNDVLENLGTTPNSTFGWKVQPVDFNAGEPVIFQLTDEFEDVVAQSAPFTIQRAGSGLCPVGKDSPPGTGSSGGGNGSGRSTTTSAISSSSSTTFSSSSTHSSPSPSPSPTPSSSSSTSTLPPLSSSSSSQSSATAASSSSSASSIAGNALTPPATEPTVAPGGLGTSTVTSLPSDTLTSSDGGQSGTSTSSNFAAKKNVMMAPVIGGSIAGLLLVLVAVFCVIRSCRRRRESRLKEMSYPFALDAETGSTRGMRGRVGYPASVASSWGNHGDLADRAFSPSSEALQQQWEPVQAQGTIESRYQAAFGGHAHSASHPAADWNDQDQERMRSPTPNAMVDMDLGDPVIESPRLHASELTPMFQAPRTEEMPSWSMIGRQTMGYPPPYTSN